MTIEEALKIAENPTGGHSVTRTFDAARVLADALRASQAQTVQMREDAALTVEDCLRTGLLTPGNVKTAAAQVRRLPLPAPAARTYDDGVRNRIVAGIEADLLDRRGIKHELAKCDATVREEIRASWRQIIDEALLSPAPAVAPVAAPKPAFDAEAALVAAREAARTGLDLNPTVEARQIAHILHRMLSDALAAGRGAR